MNYSLGRYVYALTAIGCGTCTIVFPDFIKGQLGDVPHWEILRYLVAAIYILGGAAIAWPGATRAGAVALGALYVVFSLLVIPQIFAQPIDFGGYGNFFLQFASVSGAAILYACSGPSRTVGLARFGYYSFGVCVLTFGLYQLFYLSYTASLVPKWIPPNQTFWVIATTVAFVLAAIGLLTGVMARLASKLNTAMLVGFGLLVWLPTLFADPHNVQDWAEFTGTMAIAAAAWVVADFLDQVRTEKSAAA
jgi:uncharacterized membrane protein YphA (DoxX/SURF4 family)